MKIGVTRFPGTNCDFDIWKFVEARGHEPVWLWHTDHFEVKAIDAVVVPGGFSYGDYLRCGALAARSAVMTSVRELAQSGKPVLGVCNGFQILCESGLLPGVLVRNRSQKFIDDWVDLRVENANVTFSKPLLAGDKIRLPVAHGEGCFMASKPELDRILDQGQVWIRYVENPNGSLENIAGVMNEKKNVAALMPHPERALFDWMGGMDGGKFL